MATAHHLHPLVLLPGQGQHLPRPYQSQPPLRPFSLRQPETLQGPQGGGPPRLCTPRPPRPLPGWRLLCTPLQEREPECRARK